MDETKEIGIRIYAFLDEIEMRIYRSVFKSVGTSIGEFARSMVLSKSLQQTSLRIIIRLTRKKIINKTEDPTK